MPFRPLLLLLLLLLALLVLPAGAQSLDDLGAEAVALMPPQTRTLGKRAQMSVRSRGETGAYTGVLVRGVSTDRDVRAQIRFREAGTWSDWQPLRFTFSATDPTFVAGYRDGVVRRGQAFELQFEMIPSATFELQSAGVFDNRADVDAQVPRPDVEPNPLIAPARTHIRTPRIIRRSEWGAEPFRGSPSPLARPKYLYITFHHAAGFSAENASQGKDQMRSIQDLHQNTRGWSDIGYQFVVDRAGNLYQGRPFMDEREALADVPQLAMGAHVGGENTGNIGLCILGCYHPPAGAYCEQVITPAALDSVVTLFAWLAERYDLTADAIRGHRDFASAATACPGDNNHRLLDEIRARVHDVLTRRAVAALASFEGSVTQARRREVSLTWTSTYENEAEMYRVLRRDGTDFDVVGQVEARGGGSTYTFTDAVVTSCDSTVSYAINAVRGDDIEYLGSTVVARPPLAGGTLTAAAYPAGVVELDGAVTDDQGASHLYVERFNGGVVDTVWTGGAVPEGPLRDTYAARPGPATYRLVAVEEETGCEAELATAEVVIEHPRGFTLADNFPNPFSGHTTIRYYLGANAFHVRLTIYDALGREVAVLVDAERPGDDQWHTARFDASGLASGTYYVRLTADDFSDTAIDETRPMLLVR